MSPGLRYFFVFLFSIVLLQAQTKAKVIGVKDGDTVEVLLEGNVPVVLRLADVDCPEKKQAYGQKAKEFTSQQIFGKTITYYPTSTDRYGRTIAKIYYNKKYLSEEIIKAGYGWWYEKYSKAVYLKEVQNEAKKQKRGLWKDKNPTAPWEFRKRKSTSKKDTLKTTKIKNSPFVTIGT